MVNAAHCSAAERKWFFRRKRDEFLPAPKKAFARWQPRLWRGQAARARFFWPFSWRQEKDTDKQGVKINFQPAPGSKAGMTDAGKATIRFRYRLSKRQQIAKPEPGPAHHGHGRIPMLYRPPWNLHSAKDPVPCFRGVSFCIPGQKGNLDPFFRFKVVQADDRNIILRPMLCAPASGRLFP
ncbi:MAG: hypothetical protein SWC96_04900 [Thermodesulfobacteriota bacterium]|nr:hypothetical protein [Thermodesulfobacteriota bacterium]